LEREAGAQPDGDAVGRGRGPEALRRLPELHHSASPAALAGVCMLIGCFVFRYCLLKSGVYVPAAIAQHGLDFSRLNRTGTELERQYAGAASTLAGRS